jgi:glycosyltransferase involved in cell wall biosynthesis
VRIALDATYTVSQEPTGIAVYSEKLLRELLSIYPSVEFLLCYRPKQFFESLRKSHSLLCPYGFPNAARRLLLPPLRSFDADVFHALNQRVDRRPAKYVVTTFHDLFVMTSEYSSGEFRTRFTRQARQAAANSDLIVTVSQFTASQVRDLLHVPEERIRVIPHGVDPVGQLDPSAREKIILFVGVLQIRKNVERLVRAFERVPADWRLVLAGSTTGFGAPRILDTIERSTARERIEITGYVPQDRLRDLYRRASVFAFPSLDEGFGIPVLDAMAWGLPVLTSSRSALPEVAGRAAMLVDPMREEEIAAGLFRLATDESLRDEMNTLSLQQASQFTWRKAAEATYELYKELARG